MSLNVAHELLQELNDTTTKLIDAEKLIVKIKDRLTYNEPWTETIRAINDMIGEYNTKATET